MPTGSMALTLSGNHKTVACPSCGFPVTVGRRGTGTLMASEEDDREAQKNYSQGCCPNCGCDQLRLEGVEECVGDRLLVHKHVYDLRAPRRWEMIVFRNPREEANPAADTLIKRVVGLPGEQVQIRDGDVYVNGQIAKKEWSTLLSMRSLVYDNDYLPKDAPASFRWHTHAISGWKVEDGGKQFHFATKASVQNYEWLSYRHLVRRKEATGPSTWYEDRPTDFGGYNVGGFRESPVHDFIGSVTVLPQTSGWLALAIMDGMEEVMLEIPVGKQKGNGKVQVAPAQDGMVGRTYGPGNVLKNELSWHLELDKQVRLEWALVDRRLYFVVDSVQPSPPIDLPPVAAEARKRTVTRPFPWGGHGPIAIGARGVELTVSQLQIYRDVHYLGSEGGEAYLNGTARPAALGMGEYFVLGDNSPNSYDSRCWKSGPAVQHEDLIGKAFFVHLPSRVASWELGQNSYEMNVPDWRRIRWLP